MPGKTILITDDDADDRYLIEQAVKETGLIYNLLEAQHGEDMMKLLNDMDAPYCIFLDINMPGKNGLSYLADLRSDPKYKDTAVIIYSALKHDEILDDAFEHGATLFLNKTADYHVLLSKVNKILDENGELLKSKFPRNEFEVKG